MIITLAILASKQRDAMGAVSKIEESKILLHSRAKVVFPSSRVPNRVENAISSGNALSSSTNLYKTPIALRLERARMMKMSQIL